jgi:GT2 family glycosyltransferase
MTSGILITNYQSWKTTLATLEAVISLCPESNDLAQIIVVDDASDAPQAWDKDHRVYIHHNAWNIGYVRSVNVGMAMMQVDIVIILDCDARPLNEFIKIIQCQFTENKKLGIMGFTQTDESQALRPAGEFTPTLLEFIIGPALSSRMPAFFRQVLLPSNRPLCVHSCCMAVRRNAYLDAGGFDENFDFLDADMDFSWSLLEQGWQTCITPEIVCFHPGGGSPQGTGLRVLRLHRNRWLLLCKHGQVRYKTAARLLLFFRHVVETAVLAVICLARRTPRFRDKLLIRWRLLNSVMKNYEGGHF